MTDSCIYTYHSKDPKSYGVHDQHKTVIDFPEMAFQKLFFQIKHPEHHTGGCSCHNRINRLLKHSRRNDSQNNIADHTSAYGSDYSKNTDTKNIHSSAHSYHGAGSCKRYGSNNFHNKSNDFLHNFIFLPIPLILFLYQSCCAPSRFRILL